MRLLFKYLFFVLIFTAFCFAGESSKLPKHIRAKGLEFVQTKSGKAFVKKYLVLNEKNSKSITGAYEVHYDMKGPGGVLNRSAVMIIIDTSGIVLNNSASYPGLPTQDTNTKYNIKEKKAIIVAATSGLEVGVKPWKVSFKWRSEISNYCWVITNTLVSGEGSNGPTGNGKEMLIDAVNGAVLLTLPWSVR